MIPTNWKPMLGGVAGILASIAALISMFTSGEPLDTTKLTTLLATLSGSIALLFAKQHNVTGGTVPATTEATARITASPTPPAPKGFAIVPGLLVTLVLALWVAFAVVLLAPRSARADSVAAADSPLVLQLPHDWTLRPNVVVGPLTGYRWTLGPGNPGAWLASVSIGGLYVFDWKSKFCAGLGGSLDVGSASKTSPTLEGDVMIGGPVLTLPSTTTGLRPAIVGQYTSAGGVKQAGIFGTLSLNF